MACVFGGIRAPVQKAAIRDVPIARATKVDLERLVRFISSAP